MSLRVLVRLIIMLNFSKIIILETWVVSTRVTKDWLDAWGYSEATDALYLAVEDVRSDHPYRPEIIELLDSPIHARAVFDVDGVPTVCFFEPGDGEENLSGHLNRIRERIWNQNLISVVLVINRDLAQALPVNEPSAQPEIIPFNDAKIHGKYSRRDIEAGEVFLRHPDWFNPDCRVDHRLLNNLSRLVDEFQSCNLSKVDAQYLVSQVLFVSYLEHRGIVSNTYRKSYDLNRLDDLVAENDREGIVHLLERLKEDFNGDFLEPKIGGARLWRALPELAISKLNDFLKYTDLESGQQDMWRFDFRHVPVELISGIYESFLSDEKRNVGAYYTPRHLAVLAIDQAFSTSSDILSECVFDGACGSGILLTTAYRRMLAAAEAKKNQKLTFPERKTLLEEHIFGSDLSEPACRVTAFSLYLSMMEGLQPADIGLLTDDPGVKLPELLGKNLFANEKEGDFFSDKNGHLISGRKFTLILSNPPWIEPEKDKPLESDRWAKENGLHIPRRQTAAAFMYRTKDYLASEGRLCLILPVSVLAAHTSQQFFARWLERFRLHSLTNFGDLRKLLFDDAKQPCLIACATPRAIDECGIRSNESFEYWVPKADISYAFGRLTLHASDRHEINTSYASRDNSILTTLFWGTQLDLALLTRLKLKGTLGDLLGKNQRWFTRKGFHRKDSAVKVPESSAPLKAFPFLNARKFDDSLPILNPQTLTPFPDEIETVAKVPELSIFQGPRILFVDGMSPARSIRAVFSKQAFSFSNSIGVISGPEEDANLLRFVAAYFHSSLATYLQLMTAYQANFERERITLTDVKGLPFFSPEHHKNPTTAAQIVRSVAQELENLQHADVFEPHRFDRDYIDNLIFEYFELSANERKRIQEVASLIAPNIQPSSLGRLASPLTARPPISALESYASSLVAELERRRNVRGGGGTFSARVFKNTTSVCGPLGIVRLSIDELGEENRGSQVQDDDTAIEALLKAFTTYDMLPMPIHRNLNLATDVVVHSDGCFYLIKPLVSRLWMTGEAYKDAESIVSSVDRMFGDAQGIAV